MHNVVDYETIKREKIEFTQLEFLHEYILFPYWFYTTHYILYLNI
jgi:hypothetical protein